MAKKKAKKAAPKPQKRNQNAGGTPAPKAPVKKATAKEMEDLLGAPTVTPASMQTRPAPHAPSEEDLLGIAASYKEADAKAKPVREAKCRHSAGGEIHLYDRTKGCPIDPTGPHKDWRWMLVHMPSKMYLMQEKKRPARKLMVQAAKGAVKELTPAGAAPVASQPRGKKAAAEPQPQQGASAPAPRPQAVDEDFNRKSEGPHKVPSVWMHGGSRYGLLVYAATKRAKMVSAMGGTCAVEKVHVESLVTQGDLDKMIADLKACGNSEEDKRKATTLTKEISHAWVPCDPVKFTPERFAKVWVDSEISKTEAARAYLDRILGAEDDAKAEEQDLLT